MRFPKFLYVALLVACSKNPAPQPEPTGNRPAARLSPVAAIHAVVGDSVKLGLVGSSSRFFVPYDTLRIRYYRNDTLLTTRRKVMAATVKDSMFITPFVAGSYKGCAQIERNGRTSGIVFPSTGQLCWAPWVPPLPDASLDSVQQLSIVGQSLLPGKVPCVNCEVYASTAGVAPTDSQRIQWCAFYTLKSGVKGQADNNGQSPRGKQMCDAMYSLWLGGKVSSADFRPDGTLLSAPAEVRIVDAATGRITHVDSIMRPQEEVMGQIAVGTKK